MERWDAVTQAASRVLSDTWDALVELMERLGEVMEDIGFALAGMVDRVLHPGRSISLEVHPPGTQTIAEAIRASEEERCT